MRVLKGCVRTLGSFIGWIIKLAILLAAAGLVLAALSGSMQPSSVPIAAGIGTVVLLFMLWLVVIRPTRRHKTQRLKASALTVPATIVRISSHVIMGDAAVMQPGQPHAPVAIAGPTSVLFDSRGHRIQLKLSGKQAREFQQKYSEGDTGRLTYYGDHLVAWELPSPEHPVVDARHISLFISYSHQWCEDAEYLAQFFRTQGLTVWFDKNQLRAGDRLTNEITNAIRKSHYFIPVLAPEYWASEWCIKEFELAAASKIKLLPIKVSAGPLAIPPHIRQLYRNALGEPIFLDLRGRNPIEQLQQISAQMTGARLN
jgi:hypothetical protein